MSYALYVAIWVTSVIYVIVWWAYVGLRWFLRENRRRLHAARAKADPPPQTGVYR